MGLHPFLAVMAAAFGGNSTSLNPCRNAALTKPWLAYVLLPLSLLTLQAHHHSHYGEQYTATMRRPPASLSMVCCLFKCWHRRHSSIRCSSTLTLPSILTSRSCRRSYLPLLPPNTPPLPYLLPPSLSSSFTRARCSELNDA